MNAHEGTQAASTQGGGLSHARFRRAFATRGPSLPLAGTGAPSRPYRAAPLLATFLLAAFLLALTPALASAAPAVTFAGPGEGAGKVNAPAAAAVDQSTGDPASGRVYVGELNNNRISAFDSDGNFLLAFGSGVRTGIEEAQTCGPLGTPPNSPCQAGRGGGPFPTSLVVDPATHYVYAAEGIGSGRRVQVFDSAGQFVFMFGRGVNKTKVEAAAPEAEQNVCTAASGDTCGRGEFDPGPGGFQNGLLPLAIDSAHDIWVGDTERLERFTPQGEFLSEIALPGAEEIVSLAVNPATGGFYTISRDSGGFTFLPGVAKRKPNGELIETLDVSGNARALALDPATGTVFVNDQLESQSAATFFAYDPSGAQTAAFGAGEVIGHPFGSALAFGQTAERLYAVSDAGGELAAAQYFAPPEPGPVVQFGSTTATEIHKTSATLNATFNPEGAATTYHFQYITAKRYEEDGEQFGAGTVETPESAPTTADFEAHQASFEIASGQLAPATSYRLRLVATNENGPPAGTVGDTTTFETVSPAAIDSSSVRSVTSNSATLLAEINPLGDPTGYRFEYLTQAEYEENGETFAGALIQPLPDGSLGSGSADVAIATHIQGLLSQTVYRYRVTVTNSLAPQGFSGPSQVFTTQVAGFSQGLPDGRAWELVSPPNKHGALISTIADRGVVQSATGGDAFTYYANAPTESASAGYDNEVQVLSTRGPGGWSSRDLAPPNEVAAALNDATNYPFFSSDLTHAILQPGGAFVPSISPEASEQTAFLRTNFPAADPSQLCAESCYRPLVTGKEGFANVPPGTVFGVSRDGNGEVRICPGINLKCGPLLEAATPDLSHVVLKYAAAGLTSTPGDNGGLYEWSEGQLQLISILPAGEGGTPADRDSPAVGYNGVSARNAISADGSRVVWNAESASAAPLYLRDTNLGETIRLDEVQGGTGVGSPRAVFQFASSDGSRIFFTDSQSLTPDSGAGNGKNDLYECAIRETAGHITCDLTDLTPRLPGEVSDVAEMVLGASEDGTSIYFAASGALAPGSTPAHCRDANPGDLCNLYLLHYDGTTWEAPRFIAAIAGDADRSARGGDGGFVRPITSRVSPNGRWLAFASQRSLTGYDNRDATTGKPDQEVFLYHAPAGPGQGTLVCASCNPTGARPNGVPFESLETGLDGNEPWAADQGIAASLPTWTATGTGTNDFRNGTLYQPAFLADSGRLYFNAADALVPQDTNSTGDVYQYEPLSGSEGAASTDACTTEARTYSPASEGCTDLISSGVSPRESGFLGASASGNDVFFFTNATLTSSDLDTARDVYDAHVCTASSPCPPPPPPGAPACSGDACQQPATPPNDATPGSLTFQGAGNVHETKPKKKHKKHKKRSHKKHAKKSHQRAAGHNRGGHK